MPSLPPLTGCLIAQGPQDWQILQRDAEGFAEVALGGTWSLPTPANPPATPGPKPVVIVRVVLEQTCQPASAALDWHEAEMRPDGTWQARLKIPAGGLYRIETAVNQGAIDFAHCGDTVHHLGVGDLWVIAGQSNAAGYGRGYVDDPLELGVHLLGNDEEWKLASHPLSDTRRNRHANREGANPRHSPFLVFGKELKRELGIPIGLIPTALGGSPLKMWNPVENPDAPLYKNLLHCVRLAGGRVAGIAWYQGETDAMANVAPTYLQRFGEFVASVRRDLNQPDLPFVTVQLSRFVAEGQDTPASNLAWSQVREAQRQAAHQIPRVAVVGSTDLTLSDAIHIGASGNLLLGHRLALAALELTDGKPRHARFPEIVRARAEDGGSAIVLEFAPVAHGLASPGEPKELVVEDKEGLVPVTGWKIEGRDRVRFTFARPLQPGAVVHGQYGVNPPTLLFDLEINRPVLAFHAFPVEMSAG